MIRSIFFVLVSLTVVAQKLPSLQYTDQAPADLLATRSIVLYTNDYTAPELREIQQGFQQIGIDAVAYFERDKVLAGKDPARVHAQYLVTREIKFVVLLEKKNGAYQFSVTPFNGKESFFDDAQSAWRVTHTKMNEFLQTIYRDSWLTQKKQNFLINDLPESPGGINPIAGRRSEFYAIDLKIDNLAVPKTGDENLDKEMEQFLAANYPYKYKIVEATYDDRESRKLGFHYVLCYLNTRAKAARELLGYDMSKSENAYASVTYPNGSSQIKTISAEKPVYKFYFKHAESGNVFLGTKWDADETFMQALKNHLMGFRAEFKLN
jgi:hypothetical protein